MDGMAVVADNIGPSVRGPLNVRAGNIFSVTGEAIVEDFFRLHQRKRVGDGGLSTPRLDVGLCRTMAAFTTSPGRRLGTGGNALIVCVFVKIQPDIRVARFTDSAANVFWRS